jgi:hypothetical protein
MADGNCDCEACKNNPIKLDGSGGIGDHAKLTIITKHDIEGERRETFLFPYALINLNALAVFSQYRQIMGYELVRLPLTLEGQ